MQSSRARSSSRASSSQKKPNLLTKYKERSGNRSILDDTNGFGESGKKHSKSSHFNKTQDFSKMFLQRTFKNRFPLDESFPKTSREIQSQNFNHHDPNLCVCEDCLCGRHLCKMNQVKPDLSKNSIYQKDFYRKHPIDNNINISK